MYNLHLHTFYGKFMHSLGEKTEYFTSFKLITSVVWLLFFKGALVQVLTM